MSTNDGREHAELLRGTLDLFTPRIFRSTNGRSHPITETHEWETLARAVARVRGPAAQE